MDIGHHFFHRVKQHYSLAVGNLNNQKNTFYIGNDAIGLVGVPARPGIRNRFSIIFFKDLDLITMDLDCGSQILDL